MSVETAYGAYCPVCGRNMGIVSGRPADHINISQGREPTAKVDERECPRCGMAVTFAFRSVKLIIRK